MLHLHRTAAAVMFVTIGCSASLGAPVERQVSFVGRGGVQIAGTLALPSSANESHPVPAMLLLQGSGPTDRDGNQPPALETNLMRQLADILAAEGIASLRCDKRGMYANSATLPKDRAQWPSFFDWPEFVGDAAAAFGFLASQPTVDRDRVGVLGHSEGGLLALEIAAQDRPRPKVLVLASTPGRPLGDIMHDQLSNILDRQHATPDQRKFFLDADQRIRSEIVSTGRVPDNVPPGLAALYPAYLGPFLRSVLTLDPASRAAGFKGPVLVINGTADIQVFATRDAPRFATVLASRSDGSEVSTPLMVSHNLKPTVGDNDPGFAGEVAPSVKATLAEWLKHAL